MVITQKMSQMPQQMFQTANSSTAQSAQAQTPSYMRLATTDTATGAERRIFPRKEVHDHIQGKRVDHTIAARREPFLNLALRDLSMGGLSAISQTPINNGERVSVYFPPQGVHR